MTRRPPDGDNLYETALNHLARYAATEMSLARVLSRKIDRWARLQAEEEAEPEQIASAVRTAKSAIPTVITRLKSANVLDDAAFAASRARRLTGQGKSRRAALAHLASKGVESGTAGAALAEDPERELAAACAFARRRRAGPFGQLIVGQLWRGRRVEPLDGQ